MNKELNSEYQEVDSFEKTIRPQVFDEYIGQTDVKENIKVFVKAAKSPLFSIVGPLAVLMFTPSSLAII